MLEYDLIIKYLEDSKEPLMALQVVEKLSGKNDIPYGIRCRLYKVQSDIDQLLTMTINNSIKEHIDSVNLLIRNDKEYNLIGNLLTISNNTIYCLDKMMFKFQNSSLEEYKRFINSFEEIKINTIELAKLISNNRNKFSPIITNAFNELKKHYCKSNDMKLMMHSSLAIKNKDGKDIIIISNGSAEFNCKINYTKNINNWEEIQKTITKTFFDGFKYQLNEAKKDQIKSYLYRICDKYDFPRFKQIDFKINKSEAYNIKEGWINLNINLKDEKLMKKFEVELRNAISMILFLRSGENWFGKVNLNVGKDLCFNFEDEKNIDGKNYILYSSRIGKKKILLYTFCDGVQLKGNARKKVIEIFDKHKKIAGIPLDLYNYNKGLYVNNKKLSDKIAKKYNCAYIGMTIDGLKKIIKNV